MILVKTRPAITVNGDVGAAEGLGVTFCVRMAEVVVVTGPFSGGVETVEGVTVRDAPAGAAMDIVLLMISFIDGLAALTKYCPGCISPRNS
jgi:hypothetical protein